MSAPTCPRCGGFEPFHPETPKDAKLCTPLSCSAWKTVGVLRKGGRDLLDAAYLPQLGRS